jgi:hypothetical protein
VTEAVSIKLTAAQLIIAANVGVMRRASNAVKQIQPRYGASNGAGSWEMDIVACQAEFAVAKYCNLFWDGAVNNFSARDVGGLVDVRSRTKSHYQLILHPADPDNVPFVLVFGAPPIFELSGWLFARDGKIDKFWSDPAGGRPAFFVPKDVLRPMPELLQWLSTQSEAA